MSAERDLAEAIHREITSPGSVARALDIWQPHNPQRMQLLLDRVAAMAIDAVLARRHREAARTGPWDENDTIARLTQERDEARRSAEWLRRIVQWCSKRLRHQSYADTLAAKLSAGVTDVPDDEPAIVVARTGPWDGTP